MRIGIQGWGSEGDLRPLVALAAGLRRRGHHVRIDLTPVDGTDYRAVCERVGVPLRVLPERLDFSLDTVAQGAQSVDPLKISRELLERAFFPFLDQLYASALELCEESDVVVWHYSSWYTRAAALKTGTPDASVHFFPGLVRSRYAPPGGLPDLGILNPALWWIARTALDLQFRKRPSRFFASQGLPPVRHVHPDLLFSPRLNLHAFSPRLVPPEKDWDPSHQVCGQLVLDAEAEPWQPSPGLAEFLADGDKPVLLSLGSMEHMAPKRAQDLLIGAARASGVRAIVQTKRSLEERRDGEVYLLPRAPHDALLKHCAAMVHHGGAGTMHTALRAGVPAVVVPFILEQQVWATRLKRTGATGEAVPFWKATPDKLARRIRETVESPETARRTLALAEEVRREDGVGAAAELLERL